VVEVAPGGQIGRLEGARLCARVGELLDRTQGGAVICDVGAITGADLGTVDALARVQLTARRCGGDVRLKDASPYLRNLLALAGLADVVRCSAGSVDPEGQPEHREEPGRVEEEGDPADLSA
jgi:hypothetical protein